MTYHCISNQSSQDTFTITDPQAENVRCTANEPNLPTKEDRVEWLKKPDTDHCLLNAWEALDPNQRVSNKNENPPWKLHGLIVDFDAVLPGSLLDLKDLLATKTYKKTPALLPQWAVRTPSGHHRLVWEFDKPLSISGAVSAFLVEFVKALRKGLRLDNAIGGLDEASLTNPSTYYDISGTWERVNPNPLDVREIEGMFALAVARVSKKVTKQGGPPEIPMDVIFEELQAKFPGRWPAHIQFEEGCRGPAIWDPTATNPTAVIYQKHGVYRFSDDKMFHPYAEILGGDFTRKYEQNKLGMACEDIYYAGRNGYYRRFPNGNWINQTKTEIEDHLLISHGLSTARAAKNAGSEIEQAVYIINQSRIVDGGMPLVFDKREVVQVGGHKFLNTSRVRVMEPSAPIPGVAWGTDFPWIAKWLFGFFEPRKQLVYFLSWLKLFYEGARDGDLQRGQALFLVGNTDRGKTLLNARWIPLMLGGGFDASSFLVHGKEFNKMMCEVAHWHIDDAQAASTQSDHTKFTERVKKLIANPFMPYRPMYVDEVQVPFRGRLLVTLNSDPQSMLMIPDLDRNIADKLMVLRLNDSPFEFKGNEHTERKLFTESPHFLRWLTQWTPPAFLMGKKQRFGMKTFIHEGTREVAATTGFDSDILGVMEILWETDDALMECAKAGKPWESTTSNLISRIATHPSAQRLLTGLTVRTTGMRLNKLAKIRGTGIEISPDSLTGGRKGSTKFLFHPPAQLSLNAGQV